MVISTWNVYLHYMCLVNALLLNIKSMFHLYIPTKYRSYFYKPHLKCIKLTVHFFAQKICDFIVKTFDQHWNIKSHQNRFYRDILSFIATKMLIQRIFHESISRNADWFVYQTFTKKANSRHHNQIYKNLVKFISENHTDKITCTGFVADEPHEIQQYRKSLSNWTTQQKNLINLKRYIWKKNLI